MNIGAERVYARGARRLHPDGLPAGPGHDPATAVSRPQIRPDEILPVAMLAKIANVLHGPQGFSGQHDPGVDRLRQGQSRQAHLCLARRRLDRASFGSELEMLGGIKMVHVPYHGAQPALNDVMAGNVDMFFDTLTTSVPLYRAGKLKILGVASAERRPPCRKSRRSPNPDCRTSARSPGSPWLRRRQPRRAGRKDQSRRRRSYLQKPEINEKLRNLRLDPMDGTPADAAKFFAEETQLWSKVIKENHVALQ